MRRRRQSCDPKCCVLASSTEVRMLRRREAGWLLECAGRRLKMQRPSQTPYTRALGQAGIPNIPAELPCDMKTFERTAEDELYGTFLLDHARRKQLWRQMHEERIDACAQAWCLVGSDAHRNTDKLRPWFPNRHWPPSIYEVQNSGGVRAIKERIRQGGLCITDELRPWTGSFMRGLKLSGAIKPESQDNDRRWQIWAPAHEELVNDIKSATQFSKRLESYSGTPGVYRLSRCPILLLPPEDPLDECVIAGLFAGAMIEVKEDKTWFAVPDSKEVRNLLEHWSIVWHRTGTFMARPNLWISPFYPALFAHLMPECSATRVLWAKRPAMCPQLAQIYWDILFSQEGERILPFADALPFGCSVRTYRRRGWRRNEMHKEAVTTLGITHVTESLRTVLRRWNQEAHMKRDTAEEDEQIPLAMDPGVPVPASP